MKICIVDPYLNRNYRINKDTSGGYGTGNNFGSSLIPFILRGISIIGVNSESVSLIERKKIWKNIINLKIQKNLSKIYSEITLLETPKYIDNIKKNHHVGRIIVNFFS